jgi:hypothetical protein
MMTVPLEPCSIPLMTFDVIFSLLNQMSDEELANLDEDQFISDYVRIHSSQTSFSSSCHD